MRPLHGGVPERPKGTGCKPVGSAYGGSNPPAPIIIIVIMSLVLARPPSCDGNTVSRGVPMAQPTSPTLRRPSAAVAVLGFTVVVSAVVRSVFALRHSVPRLFPDEYIYAALSRSIGHGQLQIRGGTVHFPGIFEPIVAAPIWRLFATPTAYHLVQIENAVAVSLAAIPIYVIARSMRLSQWYSVVVAVYGLLIPELVLVAYTSSDAVAYPLALGAIAFALAAFERPTTSNQVGFLVFASLATLTRIEYFVLVPAYLVGAAALERRAVWKRHRVAVLAIAPAAVLALDSRARLLRRRAARNQVRHQLHQMVLRADVLADARSRRRHRAGGGRRRRSSAYPSRGRVLGIRRARLRSSSSWRRRNTQRIRCSSRSGISSCSWRSSPWRSASTSSRVGGTGTSSAAWPQSSASRQPACHSRNTPHQPSRPTLSFSSPSASPRNISVRPTRHSRSAFWRALLAAAAAGFAFRGHKAVPIGAAIASVAVAGAVATYVDIQTTRTVRGTLPPRLNWVDRAADGEVTAIETPVSLKQDLLYQLYWNSSIRRELLLGSAIPTDAFRAPRLQLNSKGIASDVKGDVLLGEFGTTAWLADAKRIAHGDRFTLWRTNGPLRFRLVISGRFWDRWLSSNGRLRAWPVRPRTGVRLQFRLSLPRTWPQGTSVKLGDQTFILHPGEFADITCNSRRGPLDLPFAADATHVTKDFRQLSVLLTAIKISDHRSSTSTDATCSGSVSSAE